MNSSTNSNLPTAARVQLGLVSALCVVGLVAAVRPNDGFSSGDTVRVPGLGQRTPIELALLALRTASAVFALWLLVSIVASMVNLLRARSSVVVAGGSSPEHTAKSPQGNRATSAALPRLFGPGWLQQLLRQAVGGTLALALLAGPASAVTRSPQAGTPRTVLAPVASVLAADNTPVQFAGDVTTGQRWPVLPEASETATPLAASDSSLVSSPNTDISSVRVPTKPSTAPSSADREAQAPNTVRGSSQETTVTPTTATPHSAPATPPARTSAIPPTTRIAPTTTGSTTTPTITAGQQPSASAAVSPAVSAAIRPAASKSGLPVERTNLESVNRIDIAGQLANSEQPPAPSPETSTPAVAPSSSTQNAAVHVVAPGESFWAIAEQHVLAHNPKADDHEIARYWETLQTHNAHRLPAPGVPDLLFPGTELSLPPIAG